MNPNDLQSKCNIENSEELIEPRVEHILCLKHGQHCSTNNIYTL